MKPAGQGEHGVPWGGSAVTPPPRSAAVGGFSPDMGLAPQQPTSDLKVPTYGNSCRSAASAPTKNLRTKTLCPKTHNLHT